ncbi:MAG: hypothetical protein E6H86_01325 [Chloroflexi bacterium]|nr:MAG: hypothetical protein E6H86_01325 [Chloroflexota bacterium]
MRSARWIWSTLVTGAAILLVWGVFVLSFKSEPSAIGRVWIALMLIGGGSIGTAVVGLVAAVGLRRDARWATSTAWLASVLMVLTVVSSWAGIIALIGLIASRQRSRT